MLKVGNDEYQIAGTKYTFAEGASMKSLFLTQRFFLLFAAIAVGFAFSYKFRWFFEPMQIVFFVALGAWLIDLILVSQKGISLAATREVPKVASLSDANPVTLRIRNDSDRRLSIRAIDELPVELQERQHGYSFTLAPGQQKRIDYGFKPLTRGEYAFGHLNLIVQTTLGLWARRLQVVAPQVVPVYPSIIQMREMELRMMHKLSHLGGIRKMRNIGHSYEFEQIKNYTEGDDYRSINWRASGRHATLMVNQYIQERSQNVYCVIDKSRVMQMPFEGMTLLDYAINTTLAISNIIIRKDDKVGLMTFSDVMGSTIQADRRSGQLAKLLDALYREKERKTESNYELLYQATRTLISSRSLMLLFTNFESMYALERQLPYLRRINQQHLLTVIFFENTELEQLAHEPATTQQGVFEKTTARKFIQDKKEIVHKLRQHGIQTVLAKPKDLSVATINKYLELKARGLI